MIDLIKQYWQQYLCGTPAHPTGLVVTLWLTVASLGLGFILAVPLAVAKASGNRWLSFPVSLYAYVIRGTPLYVQLLLLYSGIYSLDAVRSTPFLSGFFRDAFNCTILAFTLNTAAYTTEIFAGAIKATAAGRNRSGTCLWNVRPDSLSMHYPALGITACFAGLQQRSHPDAACDHPGSDGDSS